MTEINESLSRLADALDEKTCTTCSAGEFRPVEVLGGRRMLFRCRNSRCGRKLVVALPPVEKTLVYVDTSVVSHVARSIQKGEDGSPYRKLLDALATAMASQVISCVASSITVDELELASPAEDKIDQLHSMCGIHGRHGNDVQQRQLERSLRLFANGAALDANTLIDRSDAFKDAWDAWEPMLRINVHRRSSRAELIARRTERDTMREAHARIWSDYAKKGLTYEEIVRVESDGAARAIVEVHRSALQSRVAQVLNPSAPFDLFGFHSTLIEDLCAFAQHDLNFGKEASLQLVSDFLGSDYFRETPNIGVRARLFAELALAYRGQTGRLPQTGDSDDIAHIATYAPYVDVFVADSFIADLANRPRVDLTGRFGVKIVALTPSTIPSFIEEIERLAASRSWSRLALRANWELRTRNFFQ